VPSIVRRMPLWVAIAALLLAGLPARGAAGQDGSPTAGGPYAAEDAAGQRFAFDEPVARVVCLQTACDEILADLGLLPAATVAAPENIAAPLYYGEAAAEVVSLADPESVEEVASHEPDLIYVREGMEETEAAMEAVAPVFVGLAGFESSPQEAYYENVRDLGALTGRAAQAEAAIVRFAGVLETLAAKAPEDAADLRFVILYGFDPSVYFTAARGGIFCNVLASTRLGTCAIEPGPGFDGSFGEVDPEIGRTHV